MKLARFASMRVAQLFTAGVKVARSASPRNGIAVEKYRSRLPYPSWFYARPLLTARPPSSAMRGSENLVHVMFV